MAIAVSKESSILFHKMKFRAHETLWNGKLDSPRCKLDKQRITRNYGPFSL